MSDDHPIAPKQQSTNALAGAILALAGAVCTLKGGVVEGIGWVIIVLALLVVFGFIRLAE